MRIACLIFIIVLFVNSGCSFHGNNLAIPLTDSIILPGIASEYTFFIDGENLYYASMDIPGKEHSFKCYSLNNKRILWSKSIGDVEAIKRGAITSTGEYVVPTLSNIVYLINTDGKSSLLKLTDRCNIAPIAYKNSFILHDRGSGIKCYDSKSLNIKWLIPQKEVSSIEQPFLIGGRFIFIMNGYIQSIHAVDGALQWQVKTDSSLPIHIPYGYSEKAIFILSTDLEGKCNLTSIDYKTGNLNWEKPIKGGVDVWNWSMCTRGKRLYCKADSSIICMNSDNGENEELFTYNSAICTNLIADETGSVIFGLNDNKVVRIDTSNRTIIYDSLPQSLNRFYATNNGLLLFSHPKLYFLKLKSN